MDTETVAPAKKRPGRKPKAAQSITMSREEIARMIAQSVEAELAKSGGTDTAIAAAFAASMKPILDQQGEKGHELALLLKEQQPFRSLEILQTHQKSHYNPLGERDFPRPKLVDSLGKPRPTHFCGSPLHELQGTMTREEIEALNAITQDCEVEKPGGKWLARIRKDGSTEELHISMPMGNKDVYLHYPPMLQIVQELKLGKKLVDLNILFSTMIAHATDPEAFIAEIRRLGETTTIAS